ncbi:MAG: hypothetical protein ACM3YN_08480 [Parcubacteria group bacterium]
MRYEFHVYDESADPLHVETSDWANEKAARAKAARLAKKHGGPVDLARTAGGDWGDRYITTVSASFLQAWYDADWGPKSRSDSRFWHITAERLD